MARCLCAGTWGVTREALHDRVRAYKAMGPEGLNRKRGPRPAANPESLSPLFTRQSP